MACYVRLEEGLSHSSILINEDINGSLLERLSVGKDPSLPGIELLDRPDVGRNIYIHVGILPGSSHAPLILCNVERIVAIALTGN